MLAQTARPNQGRHGRLRVSHSVRQRLRGGRWRVFGFTPDENAWSGSVSRILFSLPSEDHSSVTRVAAVIEQPTRKLVAVTGGTIASLFGLAPQGVCRAVAAHAGRGALLPHHFTLTSDALAHAGGGIFLLHFPSPHDAWTLSSLLPVGVRTFLRPHDRRSSDPLHAIAPNSAPTTENCAP